MILVVFGFHPEYAFLRGSGNPPVALLQVKDNGNSILQLQLDSENSIGDRGILHSGGFGTTVNVGISCHMLSCYLVVIK